LWWTSTTAFRRCAIRSVADFGRCSKGLGQFQVVGRDRPDFSAEGRSHRPPAPDMARKGTVPSGITSGGAVPRHLMPARCRTSGLKIIWPGWNISRPVSSRHPLFILQSSVWPANPRWYAALADQGQAMSPQWWPFPWPESPSHTAWPWPRSETFWFAWPVQVIAVTILAFEPRRTNGWWNPVALSSG